MDNSLTSDNSGALEIVVMDRCDGGWWCSEDRCDKSSMPFISLRKTLR